MQPGTAGHLNGGIELIRTTATPPTDAFRQLVDDVLTVEAVGPDLYRGGRAERLFDRLYGGQLLAQALLAATATVRDGLQPHSLHAYFVRLGDGAEPIDYIVQRLSDSRGSAHRCIQASQDGVPLAVATCSFRAQRDGFEHQQQPEPVPGPDDFSSRDAALRDHFGDRVPANAGTSWPFEVRYIDQRPWDRSREGRNRMWLRARGAVPDSPLLHRVLLLYASDLAMFEPVIAPHDVAWEDLIDGRGAVGASLDHAMWFHRQPRIDQWLLEVQHSPVATGSRGLSIAHFYDAAGLLVATATQEIVVHEASPRGDGS